MLYSQALNGTTISGLSAGSGIIFTATGSGTVGEIRYYMSDEGASQGFIQIYNYPSFSNCNTGISNSLSGWQAGAPALQDFTTTQYPDIGTCTLVAGNQYYFDAFPSNGHTYISAGSGSVYSSQGYLEIADSGGFTTPPPPDYSTHIVSVSPLGNSTIATSTSASVGAHVYINGSDYADGDHVQIKFVRQSSSQAAVASPNLLFTVFDFVATTSGDSYFSTTTPLLDVGRYSMTTTLYAPNGIIGSALNWFGGFYGDSTLGDATLIATSTSFVVSQLSDYDVFVASTTQAITNYLASSTVSLASCTSFSGFNLGDCMNLIFVPQSAPITQLFTNFRDGFLTYAPWGYVTRLVTIFTGGAITSLPVISYQAGSSSPLVLHNAGILTIDFFSPVYWSEVTAIRADDGSNKDVWDIIDPYFTMIVAFSVLFVILEDLLHTDFTPHHRDEFGGDSDGFSSRQKYQIEGMKQQQRTNYPFGRGRVGYDKKGKNL